MGFTKLFSSITESSVWCESDKTLRIWVAFLARANAEGVVEGSVPGMANLCRMSVQDFEESISPLLNSDPYSRNPTNQGRRIEVHPGGWMILNYKAYRERPQEQDGSRAEYFRKYRKDKKGVACNIEQQKDVTHTQEAEADKEERKRINTNAQNHRSVINDDQEGSNEKFPKDFIQFWDAYPRKVGKVAASFRWENLKKAKKLPPIETILLALELQKKSDQWKKEAGQFIPHPATWLSQGRWLDETPTESESWIQKVEATE